ncbi:MAG: hypothetical protein H7Y37_10025 [Anaerolineae bacterium]|nr:hypothetical protein [Gloeobacterales cyanobacterium ES-bin-313]
MSAPLFSSCSLDDLESSSRDKYGHTSDRILEKVFYSQQPIFEELIVMFDDDSKIERISFDTNYLVDDPNRPAADIGFTEARWNQYRNIFSKLKLKGGISRHVERHSIHLIASVISYLIGGSGKGYVYSKIPLKPLLSSLDNIQVNQISYKKLMKENWYLFLD